MRSRRLQIAAETEAGGDAEGSTVTFTNSTGGLSNADTDLTGAYGANITSGPPLVGVQASGDLSISVAATNEATGANSASSSTAVGNGTVSSFEDVTLIETSWLLAPNGTLLTKGTKGTKGTGQDGNETLITIVNASTNSGTVTSGFSGGVSSLSGEGSGTTEASTVAVAETTFSASNLTSGAETLVENPATVGYAASTTGCGSFASISGTGVEILSNPSNQFISVVIPFTFPVLGTSGVTSVTVTSNGSILLDNSAASPAGPLPIMLGDSGDAAIPRIQALQTSLDGGNVYAQATANSFIVSWETMDLVGFEDQTSLNFQVELFDNGDFDIRWGSSLLINLPLISPTFGAGVEDESLGFASPAVGELFDMDGIQGLRPIIPFPGGECNAFRAPAPGSGVGDNFALATSTGITTSFATGALSAPSILP